MSKVSELREQRNSYENELSGLYSRLRRYERAYESLLQFKSMVDSSHEEFDKANSKNYNLTAELDSIAHICKSAKEYSDGTKQTFNGIGANIVGAAFNGLTFSIDVKLADYRIKISGCESEIAVVETAIDFVNSAIDTALRAAETVAYVVKEGVHG